MAQFARPDADTSAGNWSASSGSSLYAMVDDAVASSSSSGDSDYITVTDSSGSAEACTLRLSDVGDPGDHTATSVKLRAYTDSFYSSVTLNINLRDGTTSIKSANFTPGTSFGAHTMSLSTTEAGNISDYTDLNIIITATDGFGMGSETRVSNIYFECPDMPPINVTPAHASAASSGHVGTYFEYSLPATAAASALSPTIIDEPLPAIAAASGQSPTVTISWADVEVTVQAIGAASAVVNSHIVTVIIASAASSAAMQTQAINATATAAVTAQINTISWNASASASATALKTVSYVFNSIATAVASAKADTQVVSSIVASSVASARMVTQSINAPAAISVATAIKTNTYVVRPIASAIAGSLSTAGVSEATILSLPASFRATYNIDEEDAAEGEPPAGEEIRTGDAAGLYAYNEGHSIVTGPTATRVMHYLRGRDGVTVYADDSGNVKFCTGYGLPEQFAVTTNTYLSMEGFDISGTSDIILAFNDEGQVIMKRDIT